MRSYDDLLRENETLRRRVSLLSAAGLRGGPGLELDTVLREAVESARVLTGARYGAVMTLDRGGQPRDFVTSGLSDEEHRRLAQCPDGPRLFVHILPGILGGQEDVPAGLPPNGYSADLLTFQDTPIRHRGVHVGNLYLVEKERGERFTSEDDETMALFAAQVAGAIANARTYRAGHLARTGLEALVDYSPVGFAVFDAGTGSLVSLNREAKRLLESLHLPGSPPDQLLKAITCRRADGRHSALEQFPVSAEMVNGERVLAEEILLSGPDGRSIRALVNATPVHPGAGAPASVVVTLQDLAPFQEMQRMQVDFLDTVSRALRAPLTSIKGSTATVLCAAPQPAAAEMLQHFRLVNEQADHMSDLVTDLLDAARIDTGMLTVSPEPAQVGALLEQAQGAFLDGGARHTVLIDLAPDLPRVAADRRRIVQVLGNLLSDAARHTPESCPLRVSAVRDGVYVAVSVSATGGGVAPGRLAQWFRTYSGARKPGPGGSGLGPAICQGLVEAHGGRIRTAHGRPDRGARVTFTLPVAEDSGAAAGPGGSRQEAPAQENEPVRILVADRDPQTLNHARRALTDAGYAVLATGDPAGLEHMIGTEQPALVLLELMLSGTGGAGLVERIPALADLPVIFICACRRDETVARALENGGADYIVKPFSSTELVARSRAALRSRAGSGRFTLGELTIHYELRRVALAGRPLELTATEYELLRVLSLNAGRVSTYATLLRRVWGRRHCGDLKLVRAFVKKLRRKLGDDANRPTYIITERRLGYRMNHPDEVCAGAPGRAIPG